MNRGIVFDIREFAVHDGPGIRTTVFLKGCPLACAWCHNPEGQSGRPQTLYSLGGTRLAGKEYTAGRLAKILNGQAAILKANEGGVTFSGGEPLMQAAFVAGVIDRLEGLHVLLDTSGYGLPRDLELLLARTQLVYYDLKLMDPELHVRYTGLSNELILDNLQLLSASGVPFVIRVPLVPGVTDRDDNLEAIARRVCRLPGLVRVDLLPYNRAAGAKYAAAGLQFTPGFDETYGLNLNTQIFEKLAVEVRIT